jgi:ketopantoate reductase
MAVVMTYMAFGESPLPGNVEFGFYSGDDPSVEKICNLVEDACLEVRCNSEMDCWIKRKGSVENSIANATPLKIDKIKSLLRNEKHKRVLCIWLEKGIMMRDKEGVKRVVREFLEITKDLGFKRIVIVGAAGNGIHYLADTARVDLKIGKNRRGERDVTR